MASEKPALNPLGFTRQAIAKYPDPVLLKKAQPIVEHTWLAASDGVLTHTDNRLVGVSQLAQSMLWLMNELNALGIAAPQVYRSVQLVVVRKKWSYSPFTTLYHTILHPATWDDIIVMCDPKVTFLGMPVNSLS